MRNLFACAVTYFANPFIPGFYFWPRCEWAPVAANVEPERVVGSEIGYRSSVATNPWLLTQSGATEDSLLQVEHAGGGRIPVMIII